MRWDRFFEDIEDQLASEWEAERAALDTEAERLRLSRLSLHDRLAALAAHDGRDAVPVAIEIAGGTVLTAPVAGIGADWLLASPWGSRAGAAIVPMSGVLGISLPHAELLRSARPDQAAASGISRRATFGFAVRDVVRRRVGAAVHLRDGRALTGTIDRAGADHLDLALHDSGGVRRRSEVTGFRIVPFEAVAWIGVDGPRPEARG
jgi:molybdopterin-binding protein